MKKTLVIIGGWDPSGKAGLAADARVLEDLALPHFSVVTALTAQNDKSFLGWEGCSPKFFRQQLKACGTKIGGVKIGMLGDTRLIPPLVQWIDRVRPRHVIWDPVLQSSSGGKLISASRWNQTLEKLLARTHVLTPNLPEAEWILSRSLSSLPDMEDAAYQLLEMGKKRGRAVLLKGGHLKKGKRVVDFLARTQGVQWFSADRSRKHPRGTGCTLASALLGYLARGERLEKAVGLARSYVRRLLF